MSAAGARMEVHTHHSAVLALFDHVHFLDLGSRVAPDGSALDRHIISSFSYAVHFQLAFGHRHETFSMNGEDRQLRVRLPTLLLALDADTWVHAEFIAALEEISDLLNHSAVARRAARNDAVAANGAEERHDPARLATSSEGGSAASHWAHNHKQSVQPLFVSPTTFSRSSYRQACTTEHKTLGFPLQFKASGCSDHTPPAEMAVTGTDSWLSRGPYCPSSQFFVFHRLDLDAVLRSLSFWKQAYTERRVEAERMVAGVGQAHRLAHNHTGRRGPSLDPTFFYRARWEFTTCELLAPNEAVLYLHFVRCTSKGCWSNHGNRHLRPGATVNGA